MCSSDLSYDLDLITNKGLIDAYKDPTTKEQYFIVRDNGDLEGKKGQVISWQSVAKANLDRTTEKEQKVITSPVGKKGSGKTDNSDPLGLDLKK